MRNIKRKVDIGQCSFEACHFKDRAQFRQWLEKNHSMPNGIWMHLYRLGPHQKGVTHKEALEEALCFGWIDSQLRKVDEHSFILKFTPRRARSPWSEINKKTALRLIREGKMTKIGFAKINEAKKNGWWAKAYTLRQDLSVPADLTRSLVKDRTAWANFRKFAKGYQNQYILWVNDAKHAATRKRRIDRVVSRSRKNLKPGLDL